jgi:type VII secretion protein EccB
MASRRDQLQSYQFMTQRVISAFVMRETDPAQSPLRRGIGAVFAGIMVAVLVGAGFGVYGLLTKVGSGSWKTNGAVVIEKETGATFVYNSNRLYPTLNYASALLASGKGVGSVFRVAHNSLTDVPRGQTVGIEGAPNSLPKVTNKVGLPWTLCTITSDRGITHVSLVLGSGSADARTADGEQHGLLVKDAVDNTVYLIWQQHKHAIYEAGTVIPALFGAVVTPAPAGTSWLNALPSGVPLSTIKVDGRGASSRAVPGHNVGDVLVTQTGSGPQYWLVFDDGLAPITPLQKALVDAVVPTQPLAVSVAEATNAKRSGKLSGAAGEAAAPQTPPKLDAQPATPSEPMCATTSSAKAAPHISTGGQVSGLGSGIQTVGRSAAGAGYADEIVVPAGKIGIIRIMPSVNATSGTYALVTDSGLRFAVPSVQVLQALGYTADKAVDVPSSLANRIPEGPALDPLAAAQPVAS